MRTRMLWKLVYGAGWLSVGGLGSSAAAVTFGAALMSDAQASGFEALDPEEDEDEPADADEPIPASSSREKAPMEFARNPFCPTCAPEQPDIKTGHAVGTPAADFDGVLATKLPITLTATLEANPVASSLAVIHDTERGVTGPYLIGEELRPGVRLASIGAGSVLLSNNGVTEYALVGTPVPQTPAAKPTRARDPPNSTPLGGPDAIACSGTTCTVKRDFVRELLRNPSVLMGQGKVFPTTTDDGRSGFKIVGARKNTLPRQLGLRSGDVLVEVAGKEATIDTLLALRAKFDRLDTLELTVIRKKKPVNLTVVFE